MKELVYCNLSTGRVQDARDGGDHAFAAVTAGEVRRLALRFVETVDGITVETEPEVLAIQLSLGKVDARPAGGKVAYQFGPGPSTPSNTTGDLPWNHNAAALRAAIPAAVTATYGACVAEDVPGGVTLGFAGQVPIQPRRNALWPLSFVRVHAWEVPEGGWVHDLRMVQAPLLQTTAFIRELPPEPSIRTIRNGGTDASGTYLWSEIQELRVPLWFRGTFHLRNPYSLARTDILSPDDSVEAIAEQLQKIYPDGNIKVTNPTDEVARIEFRGELLGIDMDEVEVFVDDAPAGDRTLTLDARLASVYAALREAERYDGFLEARAVIARPGVPQGEPMVLFREPMAIVRDQNWDGMSTQVTPLWLRPPNPVDYVPYKEDQVFLGSTHYREEIGDGEALEITVDHNLDSEDITALTVRENASPGDLVSGWRAELTGPNSLVLHFEEAPALNGLVVNVTAAGQVSAFAPHTHTQEQVDGLPGALEDLFTRMAAVEALLGRQDVVAVLSGMQRAEYKLPPIGEVLPDLAVLDATMTLASQIILDEKKGGVGVVIADTDLDKKVEDQKAKEQEKEKAADRLPANVIMRTVIPAVQGEAEGALMAWPPRVGSRFPVLLQAVSSESPTEVTAVPDAPVEGRVYRNTAVGSLLLAGGAGRRSQMVPTGGYFAFDQGTLYRVKAEGGAVYYPLEFERELWRVALGADQLAPGAVLSVSSELRAVLTGEFFDAVLQTRTPLELAAQYVLVAEAVTFATEPNLGEPTGTVVLGRTKVHLSPALETLRWALEIKNVGGSVSSTWSAYGKSMAATGFAAPMVLRLRLAAFDVDDQSGEEPAPVRGQIAMAMPETRLEVALA